MVKCEDFRLYTLESHHDSRGAFCKASISACSLVALSSLVGFSTNSCGRSPANSVDTTNTNTRVITDWSVAVAGRIHHAS